MSHHAIRWEFDRDEVNGYAVCTAPLDSDCRLVGGGTCGCEDWIVERDEDGPFHTVPGEPPVRHPMADGGECQVVLHLNESEPEYLAAGRQVFTIGITPIDPEWQPGGGYLWRKHTPRGANS